MRPKTVDELRDFISSLIYHNSKGSNSIGYYEIEDFKSFVKQLKLVKESLEKGETEQALVKLNHIIGDW